MGTGSLNESRYMHGLARRTDWKACRCVAKLEFPPEEFVYYSAPENLPKLTATSISQSRKSRPGRAPCTRIFLISWRHSYFKTLPPTCLSITTMSKDDREPVQPRSNDLLGLAMAASSPAVASIGSYCLANMAMTVTNKYVFSVNPLSRAWRVLTIVGR
jgi:hypothetical protein